MLDASRRRGARFWFSRIALALLAGAIGLAAVVGVVLARDLDELRPAIDARYPGIAWMTSEELARRMGGAPAEAPILLDRRTAEEYAVSHLRGARHVEAGAGESIDLPTDGARPIVVYCAVGYRSGELTQTLRQRGIPEVYNLEGGIFGWANEGRPVYRDGRRVREVHPYDAAWGQLLDAELRSREPGG